MMLRWSGKARLLSSGATLLAVLLVASPELVSAGPIARLPMADEGPYNGGAGADDDSQADRPAQRQPDIDEPSEDGTDGATGGNAGEPPAGCLFRDEPLELVV